jgi:hypothetical protein
VTVQRVGHFGCLFDPHRSCHSAFDYVGKKLMIQVKTCGYTCRHRDTSSRGGALWVALPRAVSESGLPYTAEHWLKRYRVLLPVRGFYLIFPTQRRATWSSDHVVLQHIFLVMLLVRLPIVLRNSPHWMMRQATRLYYVCNTHELYSRFAYYLEP